MSDATSSSVPALLVGAERANQPGEGHSHPNTAKPSFHRELETLPPPTPLLTFPSTVREVQRFLTCGSQVNYTPVTPAVPTGTEGN